MLQITKNIRLIRAVADKTQKEFALILGLTPNQVLSYEKEVGASQPKGPALLKLEEYSGIKIQKLLREDIKKEDISINKEMENVLQEIDLNILNAQVLKLNAYVAALTSVIVHIIENPDDLKARKDILDAINLRARKNQGDKIAEHVLQILAHE